MEKIISSSFERNLKEAFHLRIEQKAAFINLNFILTSIKIYMYICNNSIMTSKQLLKRV